MAAKKVAAKKKPAKKKTTTRATAKKKTVAKKKAAPKKKTVAKKKTTARKTTAKKTTAKKKTTAPKKRVVKKAAPKKTTAKKRAVKKTTAKKAAPKVVKLLRNETFKKVKSNGTTKRMYYMVSNLGRIKSVDKKSKSEHLIKGTYTKGGYHQFNIKLESGDRQTFYVHRLVAELFLPKKKKNQVVVCHKDGNKKNNKAKNITWASRDEWSKLHKKLGTFEGLDRKGGYNSKLTEAKVRTIKKALKAGKKTKTSLAKKYGVSITQINRIQSGENWGHVKI